MPSATIKKTHSSNATRSSTTRSSGGRSSGGRSSKSHSSKTSQSSKTDAIRAILPTSAEVNGKFNVVPKNIGRQENKFKLNTYDLLSLRGAGSLSDSGTSDLIAGYSASPSSEQDSQDLSALILDSLGIFETVVSALYDIQSPPNGGEDILGQFPPEKRPSSQSVTEARVGIIERCYDLLSNSEGFLTKSISSDTDIAKLIAYSTTPIAPHAIASLLNAAFYISGSSICTILGVNGECLSAKWIDWPLVLNSSSPTNREQSDNYGKHLSDKIDKWLEETVSNFEVDSDSVDLFTSLPFELRVIRDALEVAARLGGAKSICEMFLSQFVGQLASPVGGTNLTQIVAMIALGVVESYYPLGDIKHFISPTLRSKDKVVDNIFKKWELMSKFFPSRGKFKFSLFDKTIDRNLTGTKEKNFFSAVKGLRDKSVGSNSVTGTTLQDVGDVYMATLSDILRSHSDTVKRDIIFTSNDKDFYNPLGSYHCYDKFSNIPTVFSHLFNLFSTYKAQEDSKKSGTEVLLTKEATNFIAKNSDLLTALDSSTKKPLEMLESYKDLRESREKVLYSELFSSKKSILYNEIVRIASSDAVSTVEKMESTESRMTQEQFKHYDLLSKGDNLSVLDALKIHEVFSDKGKISTFLENNNFNVKAIPLGSFGTGSSFEFIDTEMTKRRLNVPTVQVI